MLFITILINYYVQHNLQLANPMKRHTIPITITNPRCMHRIHIIHNLPITLLLHIPNLICLRQLLLLPKNCNSLKSALSKPPALEVVGQVLNFCCPTLPLIMPVMEQPFKSTHVKPNHVLCIVTGEGGVNGVLVQSQEGGEGKGALSPNLRLTNI